MTGQPSRVHRSAAISRCGNFRWWLRREWSDGPAVVWVMLNPARADDARDDPTIRRVIGFSRSWGYGSAIVANLFPFRSTIPAECRAWARSNPSQVRRRMRENDRAITEAIGDAASVIAAWGTVPWARARAAEMASHLNSAPSSLLCLGTTLDGSPLHPLARGRNRVPDDRKPTLWVPARETC